MKTGMIYSTAEQTHGAFHFVVYIFEMAVKNHLTFYANSKIPKKVHFEYTGKF